MEGKWVRKEEKGRRKNGGGDKGEMKGEEKKGQKRDEGTGRKEFCALVNCIGDSSARHVTFGPRGQASCRPPAEKDFAYERNPTESVSVTTDRQARTPYNSHPRCANSCDGPRNQQPVDSRPPAGKVLVIVIF